MKYLNKHLIISSFVIATIFTALLTVISPIPTHASPVVGFNAGNIIDDGVFTFSNSMNITEIQSFLNNKTPSCDTSGTQPASDFGRSDLTHAQYASLVGWPSPPYTCLKDYHENNISSAQIIYNVAQQYNINPQVLIVLLQKEQGLVTDTWPLPSQYKTATGYGCPDNAPCDSQYYGLTNQLTWSGIMFRSIMNNSSSWYTPYLIGDNYIQYNPTSSCGGSVVNIQNRSTQALYNYTPYQPNQGALDAGWGTSYCGSYGNRNFYLYFTSWFGSTQSINGNIIISKPLTIDLSEPLKKGDTITASYEITNTASYDISAGGFGICARMNDNYYDFGFSNQNIIPAQGKITISYSKSLDQTGQLHIFTCSYNEQLGGWASAQYPYNTNGVQRTGDFQVQDNPLVTSGVTLSPASPAIGQPVTASIDIRNASQNPVNIGMLLIAARDPKGNNVDFPAEQNLTIPANTTYTYTKTQTFSIPGNYSFFIANYRNNTWDMSYPKVANSSVIRQGSFQVQDNPLVTSGVTLSPASPAIGQPVTASIDIRNASQNPVNIGMLLIAARDPKGNNVDFPAEQNLTIPANTTYTYTKTQTFSIPGNYSFFIANYRNNTWDMSYPKSSSPNIIRYFNLSIF